MAVQSKPTAPHTEARDPASRARRASARAWQRLWLHGKISDEEFARTFNRMNRHRLRILNADCLTEKEKNKNLKLINEVTRVFALSAAGNRLSERSPEFTMTELNKEVNSLIDENQSIWGVDGQADGLKGGVRQAVYMYSPHSVNRFYRFDKYVEDQTMPVLFLSPPLGERNINANWCKGQKRGSGKWQLNTTGYQDIRDLYQHDQANGGELHIPNLDTVKEAAPARAAVKGIRKSTYTHNDVSLLRFRE